MRRRKQQEHDTTATRARTSSSSHNKNAPDPLAAAAATTTTTENSDNDHEDDGGDDDDLWILSYLEDTAATTTTPSTTTGTCEPSNRNSNSNSNSSVIMLLLVQRTIPAGVYMACRVWLANRIAFTDCDEVYNYWEPLHYLLYSTGLQTWEYAHEYALRTYAYLTPLYLLSRYIYLPLLRTFPSCLQLTNSSFFPLWSALTTSQLPTAATTTATASLEISEKLALMWLLRATLAAAMAAAELLWLYCILGTIRPQKKKTQSFLLKKHKYGSSSKALLASMSNPSNLALLEEWERSKTESNNKTIVVFWLAWCLLLACSGMHHAAAALLPSATWIWAYLLCSAAFVTWHHKSFVMCAVVATLTTGWPFAALILVPMACRILVREYYYNPGAAAAPAPSRTLFSAPPPPLVSFVAFIVVWTVFVQSIVTVAIDAPLYGKITFPTVNIALYNAAAGGDELYGVEPASYYVKNLLLNLNLLFPLGAVIGIVMALRYYSYYRTGHQRTAHSDTHLTVWYDDLCMVVLPIYLWMALLFPRPHKEERFWFPLYPAWTLAAVWTVDALLDVWERAVAAMSRHKRLLTRQRFFYHAVVWIPVTILSLARTAALVQYYAAPLAVYAQLSHHLQSMPFTSTNINSNATAAVLVCTCGEWYRYPSSFYLPTSNNNKIAQLGFIQTKSFTGQLPQPFSPDHASRPESRAVLQPFNDQNRQEMSRYVKNPVTDCHYMITLEPDKADENENAENGDECQQVLKQVAAAGTTTLLASEPFLNAEQTSSTLHRTLYLPYLHERAVRMGQVRYDNFVLYQLSASASPSLSQPEEEEQQQQDQEIQNEEEEQAKEE